MTILSLDCATTTGYAYVQDGSVYSGTVNFNLDKGVSRGMRFVLFRRWLTKLCDLNRFDLISYELSHFRGRPATEIGVGMTTRIMEIAAEREIEVAPIHSRLLKNYCTGRGDASKLMMQENAAIYYPNYVIASDPGADEADALNLLRYTMDHFDQEEYNRVFKDVVVPVVDVGEKIMRGIRGPRKKK